MIDAKTAFSEPGMFVPLQGLRISISIQLEDGVPRHEKLGSRFCWLWPERSDESCKGVR